MERTVEADEVPESKTVTPVGDLSPEAKAAFREALANDGSHTVYGEENQAPERRYSDDVALSTIYRRVEDMIASDLLVERTWIESDGSQRRTIRSRIIFVMVG